MGFDDMSDPRQSVFAGAKYLREMLDNNKGDVESALRDYNGGGDPNYVEHVLSHTDYDGIAGEADTGGAYEAGASAWVGEGMPNGANGCVDAVVRIGSYYDSFLKDEADRGIAYVSMPSFVSAVTTTLSSRMRLTEESPMCRRSWRMPKRLVVMLSRLMKALSRRVISSSMAITTTSLHTMVMEDT